MIFIFEINIVNLNVEQKSPFDYKKTNRRYKSFTSLFGRHQFYCTMHNGCYLDTLRNAWIIIISKLSSSKVKRTEGIQHIVSCRNQGVFVFRFFQISHPFEVNVLLCKLPSLRK